MAADFSLAISQPAHGSVLSGPVSLAGNVSGNAAGLFFKWYSSLYLSSDADHAELNAANHGAAALNWAGPVLGEFGSHALVLAATDQDGNSDAAIKAIQRAGMTGGAPLPPPLPAPPNLPPAPCVVHQLAGAAFLNPASDGLVLSKANATIDVLAPGTWAKPDPANPAGPWIAHADHQKLNGIALALRLEPDGAADEPHSATVALGDLKLLPFFRQNDKTWLHRAGALPANLLTGAYRLKLVASVGAQSLAITRLVTLSA